MSAIKAFFLSLFALVKAHPVMSFILFVVVGVFLAAPALAIYQRLRTLPGGSALPAK